MDYGTYLKATIGNVSRRAKAYTKQKPLKGSVREVRGLILKHLGQGPLTLAAIRSKLPLDMHERISPALSGLTKDGLILKRKSSYLLAQ
jgi:A/G-specific adenine glycosylase